MSVKEIIDHKEFLINLYKDKVDELAKATEDYKRVQAKLWIDTNFAEVLDKSRPTVDEKKAYVTLQSLEERVIKDNLANETKYIEMLIDLTDDKLVYHNE